MTYTLLYKTLTKNLLGRSENFEFGGGVLLWGWLILLGSENLEHDEKLHNCNIQMTKLMGFKGFN